MGSTNFYFSQSPIDFQTTGPHFMVHLEPRNHKIPTVCEFDYVSLPEGIPCVMTVYIPQKRRNTTHGAFITPYPLFISENCDI